MTQSGTSSNTVPKLSRQETKERHDLRRQLQKTLRIKARGTGWGCARGCLFRDYEGWFVEVRPIVAISNSKTILRLHAKPMSLDPLFWDIVKLPDNKQLPLSFRASGAWTCRTPAMAETTLIETEHQADSLAPKVFEWADEQLARRWPDWTLTEFIDRVRQARNGWYFASEVTALILAGRTDEAASICWSAKGRHEGGGFLVLSSGSFVDLALAHLGNRGVTGSANVMG